MRRPPWHRHLAGRGKTANLEGLEELVRFWALRIVLPEIKGGAVADAQLLMWLMGASGRPPGPPATWSTVRAGVIKQLRAAHTKLARRKLRREGPTSDVIDALGELVGLDALERDILLFAVAISSTRLPLACGETEYSERMLWAVLARALDADLVAVTKALAPEGALRGGGLIQMDPDPDYGGIHGIFHAADLVVNVCAAGVDPRRVIDHIVPRAPAPTCVLDDFEYLGEDLRLLIRHLDRLLAGGGGKLQVLIHGPPGVGKSELVRALAVHLHSFLHEIRFESSDGDALDSNQRLLAYRLVQRLLGRTPRTLLVFEEIEDLFPVRVSMFGPIRETPEMKALTNRMLEQARVPTFFVSNEIDQMDPAVLRRFDYVLEMSVPPRSVRQRMLAKHTADLPVREPWLRRIAERADLSPASMDRAARFVRGLGVESPDEVEAALDHVLSRGSGQPAGKRSRIEQRVLPYDMNAVRTDVPLAPLVEGLRREGRGTVLFAGAPGTGKTEAAHAIAEALERPLVIRAASDLLSKWVGDTEKNIAGAFAEASAHKSVLLLDEIDSFLRPRDRAQVSWEHTQVNELLVQIERFDGVLIATTNFIDGLDRAALRRFAAKVCFEPPTTEQKWTLLLAALAALELPAPSPEDEPALRASLASMTSLAPGHFATVVRNTRLVRTVDGAATFIARLIAEHSHEPGAKRRAGFA